MAPWLSFDIDSALLRARHPLGDAGPIPGAVQRYTHAGATVRMLDGWNASLFVSYLGPRPSVDNEGLRIRAYSLVSARLSRNLTKDTRVTFDIFNVFDQKIGDVDYFATARLWSQPGAMDNYLFHPAEPRGFRIKLRTTF